MSDDLDVTLASADDVYNFSVGLPIECVMTESGALRPVSRLDLFRLRLSQVWQRATRWWRPRTIVTQVDHRQGVVTIGAQRWSWRRWRWE